MACRKCGAHGITYGRDGLCGTHYLEYMRKQQEQADINYESRKIKDSWRKHPSNYRRRHIKLVTCNCHGWSNGPCAMHKEAEI